MVRGTTVTPPRALSSVGSPTRSEQKSRVESRDTKPEMLLRQACWRLDIRYRVRNRLPGRPDMIFARTQLAIFVDGCFWHSCTLHFVPPKSNIGYWGPKIAGNVARDRAITARLRRWAGVSCSSGNMRLRKTPRNARCGESARRSAVKVCIGIRQCRTSSALRS